MNERTPTRRRADVSALVALAVLGTTLTGSAEPRASAAARFRSDIKPLLVQYCYDCHGDGMDKGKVAFDGFKSDAELVGQHELWLAVLKNLRAGLMPPEKKPRPSAKELEKLETWIKREALGIDPRDPDPGRVTLRRLNRQEYRNTIRDLMGHDYKVEDELPPDDSGYGFDNIGDVLTLSPLLLEKYMQAAETIVAAAVPRATWRVPEKTISGADFRRAGADTENKRRRERHSFYEAATLTQSFRAAHPGRYRLVLDLEVLGEFDFDPGRCRVVLKADDHEVLSQELGWHSRKEFSFAAEQTWTPGERRLTVELHPLTPLEKKANTLDLRLAALHIEGPQEKEFRSRPKNFELFFSQDPPEAAPARRQYARDVLKRFAARAYRRPVEDRTVDRLVAIAETAWTVPGKRFEDGIAQAMVPVLASPRFLFRVEDSAPGAGGKHALVDEHSLASRLSYFLWSTMPDEELFRLAGRGELRRNLPAQVKRMLADERSREFVENFTGQWLQVRDVEGIDINARAVLARDRGQEGNFRRLRQRFQELRDIPEEQLTPEQKSELERMREEFRRRFGDRQNVELDRDLRRALRQETEMAFAHVLRENRSVLELLDSDYTFLNERLTKHYGLTNVLNVLGPEMRRVDLPEDSPRGGVLTHGAVLIVTSNPTRTSPVKRGLFLLDNILGTPPPPPPANVPPLEESEKETEGRQPTLRETLAIHRENALCRSCHNRMDPLGLAMENFNALGMWRDQERGQPIDAAGKLITGEPFQDIRDIKRILTQDRRLDYYRCLTEKLLTYALGRGPEYPDVEAVDRIVARLEKDKGKFSTLLMGVIESAPFQKRRNPSAAAGDNRRPEANAAATKTKS
jgi:hypothetical protein